jgi:gamma-butyrobetaine dioxygenase
MATTHTTPSLADTSRTSIMGDLRTYDRDAKVTAAICSEDGVDITWQDGKQGFFHAIWLRDNCACTICRHPLTMERTFDASDLDLEIEVAAAEPTPDGQLKIFWPNNGHVSHFDAGWLRAHSYDDESRMARRSAPVLWDRNLEDDLPQHDFHSIIQDDQSLLHWLLDLRTYGVAIITNTPKETGQVEQLAGRVGFARPTNFGSVFDVISMQNPNSSAYTSYELPLHTDLPARELQPGLQMLHGIKCEATGGQSILADGFNLSEVLRAEAPECFEILSRELASFRFLDNVVDYNTRFPIINLDEWGQIKELRYNSWILSPLDLPRDRVPAFYQALKAFAKLTKRVDLQVVLRLQAGEVMTFDNRRVLHARRPFDAASGDRILQGTYVDTDEVLSRIDVLQR